MGIAITLKQYLDDHHATYDVITHNRTATSCQTAEASHISADSLAKGVVLKRPGGYALAIAPASSQVKLDEVVRSLDWSIVGLATEEEIAWLFPDCDLGAIPAIAAAYGLEAVVDKSLEGKSDIYFEGGDHHSLIHMSGAEFYKLIEAVPRRRFCTSPSRKRDQAQRIAYSAF